MHTKWRKKRRLMILLCSYIVLSTIFLTFSCIMLYNDKAQEDAWWDAALTSDPQTAAKAAELSKDAVTVTAGTYVEDIQNISLKDSKFTVSFLVWFKWNGSAQLDPAHHFRIYKGTISSLDTVKEYSRGSLNYQLVRCTASASKTYWTVRFPLESHQLRFYIEPDYTVDKMVFAADTAESGTNPSLSVAGYELRRSAVGVYKMEYESTHSDPALSEADITSELVTAIEINRSGGGLFFKCIIALIGTVIWLIITMAISTYHNVNSLAMIPPLIIGVATNIMVGANLLPDSLQFGLVELINIWGIFTIYAGAVSIINTNRIRDKYHNDAYASRLGHCMLFTIVAFNIAAYTLLPLCAYMF